MLRTSISALVFTLAFSVSTHDLAQALNLRVRQAQVNSDPVAVKQSQQPLNPKVISVFAQTVPPHPLVDPPADIPQAEK